MAPLDPKQLVSFPADAVHTYVERHYGPKSGKVAGAIVVVAFLMSCLYVIVALVRGAFQIVMAQVAGREWPIPNVASRDMFGIGIALVAVAVSTIWLARKIHFNNEAINGVLLAFATATKQRLDDADVIRTEHFESFAKRLGVLEKHVELPGADPLREVLEGRYEKRLEEMRLTIHSALYGVPGHENDVTELLKTMASATELNIMVTNKTMGGDPIYMTPKSLRVDYSIGKNRQQITCSEKTRLRIGATIKL